MVGKRIIALPERDYSAQNRYEYAVYRLVLFNENSSFGEIYSVIIFAEYLIGGKIVNSVEVDLNGRKTVIGVISRQIFLSAHIDLFELIAAIYGIEAVRANITVLIEERESAAFRLRHKIVGLRRYLIPQREMMNKLVQDSVFEEQNKLNMQEIARDLTTVVSELDYAKDRSSVIQEELDAQTNIDISRTMYLMSLIMVIFTPLSFLTGLLGANVKGIPFGEHENGFLILSVVLVLFACVQVAIIKKAKWF